MKISSFLKKKTRSRLSARTMAAQSGEWTFRMFGCFENVGLCVITYFLPCVTFGQTSGMLGKSCPVYALFYLIPLLNCYTATKQRGQIRFVRLIFITQINLNFKLSMEIKPKFNISNGSNATTTGVLFSVADPGFPWGGGANSPGGASTYKFAKFSQKLHEIERIWIPRGSTHPSCPTPP